MKNEMEQARGQEQKAGADLAAARDDLARRTNAATADVAKGSLADAVARALAARDAKIAVEVAEARYRLAAQEIERAGRVEAAAASAERGYSAVTQGAARRLTRSLDLAALARDKVIAKADAATVQAVAAGKAVAPGAATSAIGAVHKAIGAARRRGHGRFVDAATVEADE